MSCIHRKIEGILLVLPKFKDFGMKKLLLFVCLIVASVAVFSQGPLPDSLQIRLDEAVSLREKAEAHHSIGLFFADSLLEYSAIDHFLESLRYYEQLKDTAHIAINCDELGTSYQRKHDLDEALSFRLQELTLYELTGDKINMGLAFTRVAFVYMELAQFEKAKDYIDQAMALCEETGAPELCLEAQTELGIYYRRNKDYQSAAKWQSKALETCRETADTNKLIRVLISSSTAYGYLKDWDASLALLDEALTLNKKHSNKKLEASILGNIGWIEHLTGRNGPGIEHMLQALEIAHDINDIDVIQRSYRALARIYYKEGKYRKAYDYYSDFVKHNEISISQNQADQIADMSAHYETEKKQREIEKLTQEKALEAVEQEHEKALYEAQIDKKQTTIYFSFAALALVLILARIIFRNNKQKTKTRTLLAERMTEIKEQAALIAGQDAERKRIAQELHDGIGGSLSMIKMRMQDVAAESRQFADLEEDIGRACQELRSISHNLMAVDIDGESLTNAIRTYVDNLVLNRDIQVRYELFPEDQINTLSKNTKHNCYRIIQELTNNVIKHAAATELMVGIVVDDDGGMIMVEDNGKGFAEEDLRGDGIGMKSLMKRIDTMNGQLSRDTPPGKGSVFHIQFPTPKLQ